MIPIISVEKGKPIALAEKENGAAHIPENCLPSTRDAVDQHRQLGGKLKEFSPFGTDPLSHFPEKQARREQQYYLRFETDEKLFSDLINGGQLLKNAVLYFIRLSRSL